MLKSAVVPDRGAAGLPEEPAAIAAGTSSSLRFVLHGALLALLEDRVFGCDRDQLERGQRALLRVAQLIERVGQDSRASGCSWSRTSGSRLRRSISARGFAAQRDLVGQVEPDLQGAVRSSFITPRICPRRALALVIAVTAVTIWNSGAYKPASAMIPVGWWSGRKKLKTVGELSGRCPKSSGAPPSEIGYVPTRLAASSARAKCTRLRNDSRSMPLVIPPEVGHARASGSRRIARDDGLQAPAHAVSVVGEVSRDALDVRRARVRGHQALDQAARDERTRRWGAGNRLSIAASKSCMPVWPAAT